jgi:hypothetical protein
MISKFFEFKGQSDQFKPIKSFYLKDNLNDKVWTDFEIDKDIREDLLKIAKDYIEYLDVDIEVEDIILTGSLANYNWSEYSDFDIHILFDFSKINEDEVLVKKYLDSAGRLWNNQHDISISGFEVELYSQNISETHISSGQFSLINNKWNKKPSKENFVPDEDLIRQKAKTIMDKIDDLESELEKEASHEELSDKITKLWKKAKENRKVGLDEEGEFSIENLVFKLMRRNGYIEKLIDLKTKIYDTQFS